MRVVPETCKHCTNACGYDVLGKHRIPAKCPYSDHVFVCEYCKKRFTVHVTKGGTYVSLFCSDACRSEYSKLKRAQTNLKRYGAENAFAADCIKDKIRAINMEKYGTAHPGNRPEGRQKAKETWTQKYGADNPNKCPKIREKAKNTCLKKYGDTNPLGKHSTLKAAIDENNLRVYGTTDPGNRPAAIEKRKQTNMQRYGKTSYMQTDEGKKRFKQTCNERYGCDVPSQNFEIKQKIIDTNIKRYGVPCACMNDTVKQKISQTVQQKYGCTWFTQTDKFKHSTHGRNSKRNKQFAELLQNYSIFNIPEYCIGDKFYDFYIPAYNTAIELNGTRTHTTADNCKFPALPVDYHINRTIYANNNNIDCIHVWDWDDYNVIAKAFRDTADTDVHVVEDKTCSYSMYEIAVPYSHSSTKTIQVCNDQEETLLYAAISICDNIAYINSLQLSTINCYMYVNRIMQTLKQLNIHTVYVCVDTSKCCVHMDNNLPFKQVASISPRKVWSKNDRCELDSYVQQYGYDHMIQAKQPTATYDKDTAIMSIGWLPIFDCGCKEFVLNIK